MEYITIIILIINIIAGIFFLQLLFSEYLLTQDKEMLAMRIMEYSNEAMHQIPQMKCVLYELDNILARSLPPEEYEADEMLKLMDTEKKQMQADHIYLIAFLSEYYDALSFKDITFRCKLGIPDMFKDNILDLLVLYDYLLTAGQDTIEDEMKKRIVEEEQNHAKEDMIRIRESSQFGLWHLHMDVTITDANCHNDVKAFPALFKQSKFRRNRRVIRRLLHKHHLKWHSKYVGDKFEIDIITK